MINNNKQGENHRNEHKVSNPGNQSEDRQKQVQYQDPIICNYCKEPNHLERVCVKKRRDRSQIIHI